MVWNLLVGFRFIFTFKFWSPICLGVCHQYQSECWELKVKVEICAMVQMKSLLWMMSLHSWIASNTPLLFCLYIQPYGVVAYIFTSQLFVVVYRVQATRYYFEGCSPLAIEISMSCVILSWGSSPMAVGIFNKLRVCGENMHS
jgi:hypothetical protein